MNSAKWVPVLLCLGLWRKNAAGRLFLPMTLALLLVCCLWAQPALAVIAVNKNFSPINMFKGQTSTMTISLFNTNTVAATSTAFIDSLPTNVTATAVGTNTCGGTVSITDPTKVSLTGGTIPAGTGSVNGTCTISVTVTSNTSGTYVNTIGIGGVTSSEGSNPDAANATLTVPPVLNLTGAKSFSPNVLHIDPTTGLSTLTITLTNPNIGALTNATFIDNLLSPTVTPLVIASPIDTSGGTCAGATFTNTSDLPLVGNETAFKVTGATIPANSSCTVKIKVKVDPARYTVAQNAAVTNRIPASAVATNEGATNAAQFSGNITIQTGAAVAKAFSPTTVLQDGNSTLTITLRNYNLTAIISANLTDTLPSGLKALSASTTCGGTASFTDSTISLTGGTIPAASFATTSNFGNCTITAKVQGIAATSGSNTTNIIDAGTFGSINYSGTGNVALTVLGSPVTVAKAFNPATLVEENTTTLTITLANGSGSTAYITSFNDYLTTMGVGADGPTDWYKVAASPAASTSCGGTLTVTPWTTTINLTGGAIPALGNCVIIVPVKTPDVVATRTNTVAAGGLATRLGDPETGTIATNQNAATANLTTTDEITVAKSFSPSTIVPGGVSRLTITINHAGGDDSPLNYLSLTDNLSTMGTGFVVAPTPNVSNTCGGAVAATSGSSLIQLSGGYLALGATSCQIKVNVQAPATGTGGATNRIQVGAVNADQGETNEAAATATLTRTDAGPVTLNKEFIPVKQNGGGPVILNVTMANTTSSAIALTSVSLTDNLPVGVVVYTSPSPTFTGTGCTNGVITAVPGASSVSLSGASINALSTCTLSVTVTGVTEGNHINSLPIGALTSAQGVSSSNNPSATLTILPSVNIGKFFATNPMEVNGTSVLTIRLFNTFLTDRTNATFTDSLPSGVTVANPANASTTCAGGTVTASAGGTSVSLSGATISTNNYCDVTVSVTASATGNYTNTIVAGGLTTDGGTYSNPDSASAILTVVAKSTIAKAFSPASIAAGGTSTLTFTLSNPNSSTVLPGGLTGTSFSDPLPGGMAISTNSTAGGTCVGAATNTFTTGQTSLTFSGLTILAGSPGTCTVTVVVTAPGAGSYVNATSGVSTSQTQTAGTVSPNATLTVVAGTPIITKSFSPNPILGGNISTLTFTLTNPNATTMTLANPAFTDTFPTTPGAMTVSSPVTTTNTCGGTLNNSSNTTLLAGNVGIRYNNGSIPGNSSCTVSVKVTGGVPGTYRNESSILASTNAGSSTSTAVANLEVQAQADLAVTKTFAPNPPVVGSSITFTVTVTNNGPAETTNVTVQDSLATGYTFVSATAPQGSYDNVSGLWDIGTLGVGAPVSLDITATVLTSGPYSNTASIKTSDLPDPIPGNNSATANPAPTNVADFAVTKSFSVPSPCGIGCTATYTINLTNLGPSPGTSITVTDILPIELTFGSFQTIPSGTANEAGGTVTWNAVNLAKDATQSLVFTATVNHIDSINNCASRTASTPEDSNATNDTGCADLHPTGVALTDFRVLPNPYGSTVEWETATETGTIGFHLYRRDGRDRQFLSVTTSLLPGLLDSPEGGSYRFTDEAAPSNMPLSYLLVEHDTNGKRIPYGPFSFAPMRTDTTARPPASLDFRPGAWPHLPDLPGDAGSESLLNTIFDRKPHPDSPERLARVEAARLTANVGTRTALSAAPSTGTPAAKVSVRADGLYFLDAATFAPLLGFTVDQVKAKITSKTLSLKNNGKAIAWLPAAENSGIWFYGQGVQSQYTDENVYWLTTENGLVMASSGTPPKGQASPDQVFLGSVHAEEDQTPARSSPIPETVFWCWKYVVSGVAGYDRQTFPITVDQPASGPDAILTVHLLGATSTPIKVTIALNGTPIGEDSCDVAMARDIALPFPSSLLHSGENTVEVTASILPGGVYGIVYVDAFDLSCPRRYRATGDMLRCSGDSNKLLTAAGFTTPDAVVLDVTDPSRPKVRASVVKPEIAGNSYQITFTPASASTPYVVTTLSRSRLPQEIMASTTPSRLLSKTIRADWVAITTPELHEAAQRLAARRQAQGLETEVVLLEEVMDGFASGIFKPQAIRDFITYAATKWAKRPRFVVLVGEGSCDYRNILGKGGNLIPPLLIATPFGVAAADSAYGDTNGNSVPEVVVGRLPVISGTELDAVTGKIAAYEDSPRTAVDERLLLLADPTDPNAGNFQAGCDAIAAIAPAGLPVEKIYRGLMSAAEARSKVIADLQSGVGFLAFAGHSTLFQLSNDGLLKAGDVPILANRDRLPIVTADTCYINGYQNPGLDTLGEVLIIEPSGGAVAVLSSSLLSMELEARTLVLEFHRALWNKNTPTIGEALKAALQKFVKGGGSAYLANTYVLLGDPATRTRMPGK
jgi:uncharacterized repeat protein (TIGR01451 family)